LESNGEGGGHTTHSQFTSRKETRYALWRRLARLHGQYEE